MTAPAIALPQPRRAVVSVAVTSVLRKKPAMTVVAKDELAQSYIAQERSGSFLRSDGTPRGYQNGVPD